MPSSLPIIRDPCYGDLELLLKPEGPGDLLMESGLAVESVRRNYIRLKPGSGALLGLVLVLRNPTGGGRFELPAYIRSHDAERASQIAAKWHCERSVPTPAGDGVRLLSGGRSVLFLFPNDARVRGMRFIADVDKLKRILADLPALHEWRVRGAKTKLHVQRYKPERRLILRADLGLKDDRRGLRSQRSMFLRFFVDERGEQIAQRVADLRNQEVGAHIPEPLGSLEGGRMYAEQAVEGIEGLAQVEAGLADPIALAQVLAKLHRSKVADTELISNEAAFAASVEAGKSLALLAPELEPKINAMFEAMQEQIPPDGPQAFLHGDLHLHQVLWTERGPVLVDFERSACGHPLYDLGQALAHLQVQTGGSRRVADRRTEFAEVMKREYARLRPDLDFKELRFFLTQGLLQRALLPARRLSKNWAEASRSLVDQAWDQISKKRLQITRSNFFDLGRKKNQVSWDRFYPNSGDFWPGRIVGANGDLIYGRYDCDTDHFLATKPQDDRELPGLKGALSEGQLVAYRPGRRAMVRCQGEPQTRFIKFVRPRRLIQVLSHHLAASTMDAVARPPFPIIPALIEVDPDRGSLSLGELRGQSLHAVLSLPNETKRSQIAAVAQSLAALHHEPVPSGGFPSSPTGRSLQAWVELVWPHDAQFAKQCQETLLKVDKLPRGMVRQCLVHGDLHDRNILLCDNRVALLDLDDFGLGDPLEEIGNLLAHFILRSLQRGETGVRSRALIEGFLGGYRQNGGIAPQNLVEAAMARTLLRLACLYRFRRNREPLCGRLLAEAARMARSGYSA